MEQSIADPIRATIGRSLSCPARQAVRISKKPESESVGSRIQKLLNQIGSPDHWSNWIRSLSPPQRQRRDSRGSTADLKLDSDPELNAATSPCVPSVWLRMQSEHLADPNKKSGSLPRSFQVSQFQVLSTFRIPQILLELEIILEDPKSF